MFFLGCFRRPRRRLRQAMCGVLHARVSKGHRSPTRETHTHTQTETPMTHSRITPLTPLGSRRRHAPTAATRASAAHARRRAQPPTIAAATGGRRGFLPPIWGVSPSTYSAYSLCIRMYRVCIRHVFGCIRMAGYMVCIQLYSTCIRHVFDMYSICIRT